MSKLYIPFKVEDYHVVTIKDKDTIRVYNNDNTYTDIFVNSHYIMRKGVDSTIEELPYSIDHNQLTNDFYYRNDLDSILICFLIISIFIFYIPFKFITKFGKWLR